MTLRRIVSGGQTGVDRAALDAALDAGFPCGGWCPPAREAEDGPIPGRYPLDEMPSGGYLERTIRNVEESDGTLVIHFGPLRGGTERTVFLCTRLGRPFLLVDGDRVPPGPAADRAADFIAQHRIAVLNVAGPRASQSPQGHHYAYTTVTRLLGRIANP